MFLDALTGPWRDSSELVALCDLSMTRMTWHRDRLAGSGACPALYPAAQFTQMIHETQPDVVIVTTVDSEHDQYLIQAMELGCDVITEKPLTTDAAKASAIFAAQERTGRNLRVAFNYRYAPAYTRFRELIHSGQIGQPLAVDFSWLLDTSHGADYFRRWHREKEHSGGLLVHKATHHFDLVNWWLDSWPQEVMALGDLLFYGRSNAEARGEHHPYERYTGVPAAQHDPFALDLTSKAAFEGLYLNAEGETGYLRDRNVFGDNITIEDTMSVSVRYRNRAILSYSLIAYSPWEGLRVAITGTRGRAELDIAESIDHLAGDGKAANVNASKGPFKQARMLLHHSFGATEEIPVPRGDGGHGGGDPLMLEQLFSPDPPADPHKRAASHIDGAASILVGIAANESLRSGRLVGINDLFPLYSYT
jgi:predicted dehydrogenase